MRAVTIGLLVVALAAAGGIAYLLNTFLTTQSAETEARVELVRVLVSSKVLPAGATVDEASLEWHVWPDDSVSENYMTTTEDGADFPAAVIGAIVRRAISAGEPIVAGKIFKRDSPGYLAGSLSAGMRAATITVNAASGIAGFVFPGDRVDVLLTHDNFRDVFKKDAKTLIEDDTAPPPFVVRFVSEVILKNLLVLAIDQKVNDFETQSQVAKQVTLEMTIKQAEMLATAKSMGKLSLALRSLEPDSEESDEPQFTTDVEVSPLLSNIKEVLRKRREALSRGRDAAPAPKQTGRLIPGTPPPPPPPPKITSANDEVRRMRVYRGPNVSTQVFGSK